MLSPEGDLFDIIAGRYSSRPNLGVFLQGHKGERPGGILSKPETTGVGRLVGTLSGRPPRAPDTRVRRRTPRRR
ncbi:hypothetical protein [Streptomyces lunaelactis]|uniref:hypothetical protein n=1 Tax=Streptomyces lunaelactis TaxID=1535768 RepID=UPI0035A0AB76